MFSLFLSIFDWICQQAIIMFYLNKIQVGQLLVTMPDGTKRLFGDKQNRAFRAEIIIHSPAAFRRMVLKDTIGLADAYMDAQWDSPNLTRMTEVIIENVKAKVKIGPPFEALSVKIQGIYRYLYRNTQAQSLANVQDHYDIGNDMYKLMLDIETLGYTCALWRDPTKLTFKQQDTGFSSFAPNYLEYTLAQAQYNKFDLVIKKAGIQKGDRVLELGCGWGAFAIRTAQTTGAYVQAYNLSVEQLKEARSRAEAAGVSHLCNFVQDDYRNASEPGTWDRIVSIGMMEHVGHYFYGDFFKLCDRMLKPGGTAVVHTITSPDSEYEVYRLKTGFIQHYIFPGCCIPSVESLIKAMATTRLEVQHLENIGENYAITLRAWRENFYKNVQEISKLQEHGGKSYDEKFQRMFDFYLCNCEAEFTTGHFGLYQFIFRRPSKDYRGESIDNFLPPLSSLYTGPGQLADEYKSKVE